MTHRGSRGNARPEHPSPRTTLANRRTQRVNTDVSAGGPRRVLVLAPQPFVAPRGTPLAVKLLAQSLADDGWAVDILTYHLGEDFEHPRVRIRRIAAPPLVRQVPIGPSWQKLVCDLWLYRLARRMLREQRYDVIHAVEESALMAPRLAARHGLPFVFDMDSVMSAQLIEKSRWLGPVAGLFRRLESWALRRSAAVLAVCPELMDYTRAIAPDAKVHLLPDVPIGGRADGPLPGALTSATGLRLLYVGNLQGYQGVDLMLEAFARVAPDRPDAVLLVVGGEPAAIGAYRDRLPELGLDGRVRFVGPVPVERLDRVLEYGDVLVSPRTQGGNTPMKLYSYLQSGRVVLATRLSTHTQVLDDRVAKLADPEPEAFAASMRELLADPGQRERLGAAGRALVEEQYSHEAYRRRLRQAYASMRLGEHPALDRTADPAAHGAL